MSDDLDQQRSAVYDACVSTLQQLVAQLVNLGLDPRAVAQGIQNAMLTGIGVLTPDATEAARLCTGAALSYLHHENGHCSIEAAQ